MTRQAGGSGTFDGGDWPKLIVGVLIVERERGRSFDDAFFAACVKYPPSHYGYGRAMRRDGATETAFAFFKRHCAAAYVNAPAQKYCERRDCTNLARVGQAQCADCMVEREEAA